MLPRAILLALGLTAALASPAAAAVFIVTTTADTVDADLDDHVCADAVGDCSLRAAVMQANYENGPDVISIPAGVFELSLPSNSEDVDLAGNIDTEGDLDLNDDVTIIGTGSSADHTVIDGLNLDRVFSINTEGIVVSIEQLRIRNGFADDIFGAGGGIFNVGGDLTLRHVDLVSNDATFDAGGAIASEIGVVELEDVRISGNIASFGGGIAIRSGALSVLRTTVDLNEASCGGGIILDQGDVVITSSTITDNVAFCVGGGLLDELEGESTFTVLNSTLAYNFPDNYSGFNNEVVFRGSLLVATTTGVNCDVQDGDGTLDGGGNFAAGAPCDIIPDTPAAGGLTPLTQAANGQFVYRPLHGNPVIDSIDPLIDPLQCAPEDQRGITRPQGVGCDAGAVENVPVVITSGAPPSGNWNTPFAHSVIATSEGPVTFALTGGLLPPGLTLSASGVITGTPTTVGVYGFTVTATDELGLTASLVTSIQVIGAPLVFSVTPPPAGAVGTPYSFPLTATGNGLVSFAQIGGTLPPGVTLSAAGLLAGTPTTAGAYAFTVQVQDQAAQVSNVLVTVAVHPPLVLSGTPPIARQGQPYSFPFTATGVGTITFSVSAGSAPSGLTLSPAGVLSGTPSAAGVFSFTVQATDQASQTQTLAVSLTVDGPPTLSGLGNVTIVQNTSTTLPFVVADDLTAAASLTVSASSGNQTLLPNAGVVVGGAGANRTLTLTPAAGGSGLATVTVTVSDGNLSASVSFNLTVDGAPTISGLGNTTIGQNTSTTLTFVVGDDLTPAAALTVSASSSDQSLLPNASVILGGAGANRTLTLTPVPGETGAVTVTVTVGDGTLSTPASFVLTVSAAGPLEPPEGLAINVSGVQATFTWRPPTNGLPPSFYVLEIGSVSGGAGVAVIDTRSPVTAWAVTLAPSGYYARVRSGNAQGLSQEASNEIAFAVTSSQHVPGPPRGLTATATGAGVVTIAWQLPVIGGAATGWQVQAGRSPGASDVGTFELPANPLTASGVLPAGEYFIRLRGRNAFGLGTVSNEVQVRVGSAACGAVPDAPVLLPPMVTGWSAALQWTVPANAPVTGYTVIVGSAPGQADIATLNLGSASSLFAQAVPGAYHVAVQASNGCGLSATSNSVAVVIGSLPGPPAPPTNVRSQVAGHVVRILWDGVAGAGSFVVEAGGAPGATGAAVIAVGRNEIIVENVPSGVYYVRARAIGTAGAGSPSPDVLLVVP